MSSPTGTDTSGSTVTAHVPYARGAMLGFVVVVFALCVVLVLGFRVNDGSLLGPGFTFGNMSSAIHDPLYARVVLRLLVIVGAVTVVLAYYAALGTMKTEDKPPLFNRKSKR